MLNMKRSFFAPGSAVLRGFVLQGLRKLVRLGARGV
jgi:hypothetical protein